MLQYLHVKNLALIDEIEVDFTKGLNILTGETGAGKSILLGSVNLALGGRYTKEILRQGAKFGLVELIFRAEKPEQIRKLEALGVYPEDGMIVFARRMTEGKSISRINGETVPMSLLKAAASVLIDICGQHEHQSLLDPKHQLGILDGYAGDELKGISEQVRTSYEVYRSCAKEFREADLNEEQRLKEAAFLEFEIQEIENANLQDGEDEELEERYRRMRIAGKIAGSLSETYGHTCTDRHGNASDMLSHAIRRMSDAARYDRRAKDLEQQLLDIDNLLNDFNRELSEYIDGLEYSEEEFRAAQERLNEINRLKSKYGNTVADIRKYQTERKERLQILNDYERYMDELRTRCEQSEKELGGYTEELSRIRRKHGEILSEKIREELKDLNFADVRFEIAFHRLPGYTASGRDEAEFLISMNPGEPVRPLSEIASGGELSRVMLAIKTVMAGRDEIETLIFDEIDAGISGRTAQKVSEKMAVIGRSHQVLCITHLAQIAAMADSHYVIEKTVEGQVTRTEIRMLSDEDSIQELSRILGGAKITETVRQNAGEMKELAKKIKQKEAAV